MNRKQFLGTLALVGGAVAWTTGCALFGGASAYEKNLASGMKTPETSKLFVKYVDPLSGVVSYLLKPGLIEANQQSLYFTTKSMTEDGRFLVLDVSENEYSAFDVKRPRKDMKFGGKHKAVIDLLKDEFIRLDDIDGQIPYLDVDNDELYYARFSTTDPDRNWLYKRALLVDPTKEIPVCRMPEALTKGTKRLRYFTHLTLSHDRTLAYLDSRVDDKFVQGVLNIKTGEYTPWHDAGQVNINHGQINPARNDIALNAYECVPWTDSKGVVHDELRDWGRKHPNEPYPRLQLIEPGKRTMVPAAISKYATHERWNEQGDAFYWCAGGVFEHDLATGRQRQLSPKGAHAMVSRDKKYVVADSPVDGWWRGCAWQVYFHNISANRGCYLFTYRPPMCTKSAESGLHPDPHPQFVCGDRYVVCTINNADGHMDFAVTPVDQLIAKTACDRDAYFRDLPAVACPKAVGKKLSEHFLETPPDKYGPKGCERPFKADMVPYSVVSLWINAMEFARTTGDQDMEKRLVAAFEPFYDGGTKAKMRSQPFHVDFTIFGAIPYQIYLQTGDARALKLGNHYANTQWRMPTEAEIHTLPKWVWGGKEQHILPKEDVARYAAEGYSPQTRLWIDDMYMITVLQTQAYRATQSETYLRRAAHEALLYIDKLQLKEGPTAGLFYHAPDVPFLWGRGNGWMAAGMPLMLRHLQARDGRYAKLLAGYQKMMAALLKYQRANSLWGQLIDDPQSWDEMSGSAMFTYAFIMGVRHGWLDAEVYGPAARKAWIALCSRLDEYGNMPDVCVGTGKFNDHQYYIDRKRLLGDPHGQAPMLWCVNAIFDEPKVEGRIVK